MGSSNRNNSYKDGWIYKIILIYSTIVSPLYLCTSSLFSVWLILQTPSSTPAPYSTRCPGLKQILLEKKKTSMLDQIYLKRKTKVNDEIIMRTISWGHHHIPFTDPFPASPSLLQFVRLCYSDVPSNQ